jgi:hypothetical protein
MYYNDPYHPTTLNELDSASETDDKSSYEEYDGCSIYSKHSIGTNLSKTSRKKLEKKLADELKLTDKGFNLVKLKMHNKTVKLEYYETSTVPGMKIRNAITGLRYDYLVGSKDEDYFFKVNMATGFNGKRETVNLFFEDPAQCERLFRSNIKVATHQKWTEKYRAHEQYMNSLQ